MLLGNIQNSLYTFGMKMVTGQVGPVDKIAAQLNKWFGDKEEGSPLSWYQWMDAISKEEELIRRRANEWHERFPGRQPPPRNGLR